MMSPLVVTAPFQAPARSPPADSRSQLRKIESLSNRPRRADMLKPPRRVVISLRTTGTTTSLWIRGSKLIGHEDVATMLYKDR